MSEGHTTLIVQAIATVLVLSIGFVYGVNRKNKRKVLMPIASYLTNAHRLKGGTWEEGEVKHSKLRPLMANLWTVQATIPRGPTFQRNMIIYRFPNSRQLLLHSVVWVNEETMKEIAALGDIAYIIVPNRIHRIDIYRYHMRFPSAQIFCPTGVCKSLEGIVPVARTCEATFENALRGKTDSPTKKLKGIRYLAQEGLYEDCAELIYFVELEQSPKNAKKEEKNVTITEGNTACIFNDLMFNLKGNQPSSTSPEKQNLRIGSLGKFFAVEDPKLLQNWINEVLIRQFKVAKVQLLSVVHGEEIVGQENILNALHEAATDLVD